MTKFNTYVGVCAASLLSLSGWQTAAAQTQNSGPNPNTANDEIIVTGSPLLVSADQTLSGSSILSGDELQDRLAATIGETLKLEPGVSSSFFGAGASRPIVRGQGGLRVRVLTNGIGSIDASSASPDHAVAVEPAQSQKIEVLRGAALLRFGSSGAGGVINVIDNRIPQQLPDGAFDGGVRIGASSADNGIEAAGALTAALGENFTAHLDAAFRESDDYAIPGFAESERFRAAEEEEHEDEDHDEDHEDEDHDEHEDEAEAFGGLPNSHARSLALTGGLSYVGARGFFGGALHRFDTTYGIPGGHAHGHEEEGHDHEDEDHEDEDHDEEEHEEEEEGDVEIELKQTRFDINGALELGGAIEKIQLFGGYADYEHTEFEGPGIVGTVFTNKGYELRAEAIAAPIGGLETAYGLHVRTREFAAVGEEAFVDPTDTTQLAGYAFAQKDFGRARAEGAVRYENTSHDVTGTNISESFDLLSASLGAALDVGDDFNIGISGFRTQRAPSTEELYSNGPHLATGQFELGDPDLGREQALGGELTGRYRGEAANLTLNLFYTDYDGYIFDEETDAEEDGLPVYAFVQSDAVFKGFEVAGDVDLGSIGNWNAQLDGLAEYVRATADGANLPRIPPLSLLAGLELSQERWSYRAELDYAASQTKITEHELPTDSYALVNVFATWHAPVGAKDVALRLSIMNLLNDDARQHTSFLKDEVPLPGRNVRFSISHRF